MNIVVMTALLGGIVSMLGSGSAAWFWYGHMKHRFEQQFVRAGRSAVELLGARAALALREQDDLGLSDLIDHAMGEHSIFLSIGILDRSERFLIHSDPALTNEPMAPPGTPEGMRFSSLHLAPLEIWMPVPSPESGTLMATISRIRLNQDLQRLWNLSAALAAASALFCTLLAALGAHLLSRRLNTFTKDVTLASDGFRTPQSIRSRLADLQHLADAISALLQKHASDLAPGKKEKPLLEGRETVPVVQTAMNAIHGTGLLIINEHNTVTYANDEAARLLGRDPSGLHLLDAVPDQHLLQQIERVLKGHASNSRAVWNEHGVDIATIEIAAMSSPKGLAVVFSTVNAKEIS